MQTHLPFLLHLSVVKLLLPNTHGIARAGGAGLVPHGHLGALPLAHQAFTFTFTLNLTFLRINLTISTSILQGQEGVAHIVCDGLSVISALKKNHLKNCNIIKGDRYLVSTKCNVKQSIRKKDYRLIIVLDAEWFEKGLRCKINFLKNSQSKT